MSPENLDPNEQIVKLSSEIDAHHGTMIEDLDQPLILYKNRNGALKELNIRFTVLTPIVFVHGYFALSAYPERWWMAICFLVYMVVIYSVQRRLHARAILPVAEMNSSGLILRSQTANISIQWNEIKEVRAHRYINSLVGIVLVDTAKTASRATLVTKCYIWSHVFCVGFYRLLGIFVAPIELFASEFPLSADALAEQINLRRTHFLKQAALLEGRRDCA